MRSIIWIGVGVGSTVGGWLGSLLGGGIFGWQGMLGATIGGIAGIYVGYRANQYIGG